MLTAEERILLHLLGHVREAERYEVPFGLTQAGIALATGERRSHVSATLAEMGRRGLLSTRVAHVQGGGRRRKSYALTPAGAQIAESLRTRASETRVRVLGAGGERATTLGEVLRLAPRGSTLLDLALAVDDGVLDLTDDRLREPPTTSSPRRFYGRAGELDAMGAFLSSTAVCLAVRGLPGVGKTALLAKAMQSADLSPVWIRANEWTTSGKVLGAIAAKLREVGRPIDEGRGREESDLNDRLARLQVESAAFPLLLAIDDVQKAPRDLAGLLEQLVVSLSGTRGKVIVVGRRIPKFYSRREVEIDGSVQEIHLEGLDDRSSRRLLSDRSVPEDHWESVLRATKGHPLFLELMAASGGTGAGSVRAYLREEIASRLDPREAEILYSLSVHRGPVGPEAVSPDLDDVARVESLADRSLVRHGGGLVDLHDTLREFFYGRLTPSQRARLHARAIGHYEPRTDPASRVELIYHTILAGRAEEAASILGGIGASLAAKGLQEETLLLVDRLDLRAIDEVHRLPLLILRGELLGTRGDWGHAERAFGEALAVAEDQSDRRAQARAILELGVLEYRRGDEVAARELFQRARSVLGDLDQGVLARILNADGILEWHAGNLEAAADLYRQSKGAYEATGDTAGVAGALNNLGILRWQQGDVEGALSHYADALRLSEQLGDTRTVAILYNNIGEAYRRKEDGANAARFYEKSLALATQLGFLWQMGEVHRNLGRLFLDEKGSEHLREALSIFERLGARRDQEDVRGLLQDRSMG